MVEDLDDLTKEELYARAQDLDIAGRSTMDREQLLDALRDPQVSGEKGTFVTPRVRQGLDDVLPGGRDLTGTGSEIPPPNFDADPDEVDESAASADQSSLGGTGGTTTDFG